MGMLDQFKAASELMQNMSPEDLKQLMKQAEDSKKMMEDMVKKLVAEEIEKKGLVTREEVEKMLQAK